MNIPTAQGEPGQAVDRQTDSQAGRQDTKEPYIQTAKTAMQPDRHTCNQTLRHTHIHTAIHPSSQADRQPYSQATIHTHIHTYRQTCSQTGILPDS